MRDKDGHHFIVGAEIKEPFSSDGAQFMAELLKGICPDDPIARRILSCGEIVFGIIDDDSERKLI